MRDIVREAEAELRARHAPEPAWSYDLETTRRIQAEINEGLEDSARRSRDIQARSEASAANFFLTF